MNTCRPVSSTVAGGGASLAAPAQPIPRTFGESRTPEDLARQGYVTDASGLVFVRPAGIVQPTTVSELVQLFAYARDAGAPVTISGTRHAMGGQALRDNALLVDTRALRGMAYEPRTGLLTVQPGASWADVQRHLDPHGRSVAVMQSSNIFSVGGSLAVNAHGRDVRFGPVSETVESIKVLLPDARIVPASRTVNPELFRRVLGGYGLFGVITEACLRTVPNELYRRRDTTMPVENFAAWWQTNVAANPDARLMQARLSIAPSSLMQQVHVVSFDRAPEVDQRQPLPQLRTGERWPVALWEKATLRAAEFSSLGREAMWWMEKHLDPVVNGRALVSRNQAMSPDVEFLRSGPSSHTQVLQEYFVPRAQLANFVGALRQIATRHGTEMLNATIRDIHPDTTTALPYARGEGFSVVLYMDQNADAAAQERMDTFAREAADAAIAAGGSMYLPYRLAYTDQQLSAAYPDSAGFLAQRGLVDPGGRLANSVSDRFAALGQ